VWPYLLVARDFEQESNGRHVVIERRLKKIRKRIQQQLRLEAVRVGPTTFQAFSAYRAMYRLIDTNQSFQAKRLFRFLHDQRKLFQGDLGFFKRHDRAWKATFRNALGPAGREFLRIANTIRKRNPENYRSEIVNETISRILKDSNASQILQKGAISYAFLRSVYGLADIDDESGEQAQLSEWATLMYSSIQRRHSPFRAEYSEFLGLIKRAKDSPPLAQIAKKRRDEGARFMAGLRFHNTYALYFESIPSRIKQQL
jgi:hypothetical protein